MRISEAGLALIKHFESLRLRAYDDKTGKDVPAGGVAKGVLTIGWGHTGPDVYPGQIITEQKALQILEADALLRERGVSRLVRVDLSQFEFDALVSFAFNLGLDIDDDAKAEGLGDSTLLRKLNAGDRAGAAAEFPKWNKDNGLIVAGLVRRRKAEQALFLGLDWRMAA